MYVYVYVYMYSSNLSNSPARGVKNIKIERQPAAVRSCEAPQMSRGAPHHLRQIHQQQQNATQK